MFTIIGGDGKEYGPVSVEQVREWLASGRANLDTRAKHIGYEQWKRLGDFDEFAPQPLSAPPMIEGSPAASTTVLAARWRRLLAAFIDGLLTWLCAIPTTVAMLRVLMGKIDQLQSGQFGPQDMFPLIVENIGKSAPFLVILVVVQAVLLTLRGQSVGKLLLGIRIVRFSTEAPADFLHVYILRSLVPFLIGRIPLLNFFFWITDICFIFREDQRCLHDLMADTKVVNK
jgi:uncharacterized RDD family membrane protein YckC